MAWEKGKRRHPEPNDWVQIIHRVKEVIISRSSIRSLARTLNVSDRTLRRWLSMEDIPPEPMQSKLREFCGYGDPKEVLPPVPRTTPRPTRKQVSDEWLNATAAEKHDLTYHGN